MINTQRMLTSNQESYGRAWPFLEARPPVILDWLPWNHTFGGNSDFNMILRNGGTLYIDEGRPVPGLIEKSVANLREVAPTIYFNVPRGFAMLLDHLERDAGPCATISSASSTSCFYAGAALPQSLWARLEALSLADGRRTRWRWSRPGARPRPRRWRPLVHYPIERAGNIGLPAPGCEIKLVPDGDKLEMRVRGPNITPGYWKRPDLTAAAFDDEGFYRPGDAARLDDPGDPSRGIVFDGRIGENFKLSSGTWVSVGALRVALIAACAAGDRGRRGHRPRPRRDRASGLPEPRRLPRPVPASAAGRAARRAGQGKGGGATRSPRRSPATTRPPAAAPIASPARCCWTSRPRSTRARSPTRATSTSARC